MNVCWTVQQLSFQNLSRKQNLNISILKEQESNNITVEFGKCQVVNFTMLSFQELIESLGIYFVLYDRAGYGESDPNPRRPIKSEAFDIVELADQLQLGSKFYVIGVSIGSYPTWSCLKYIPHRQKHTRLVANWFIWKFLSSVLILTLKAFVQAGWCCSYSPNYQLRMAFSSSEFD